MVAVPEREPGPATGLVEALAAEPEPAQGPLRVPVVQAPEREQGPALEREREQLAEPAERALGLSGAAGLARPD